MAVKKINVVWVAAMVVALVLVGCGAWYGHEPGSPNDWPDRNVGVVDEMPTHREEPSVVERERTLAIAFEEYEDAERERTRCVKMRPLDFTGQECETFDGLDGKLYALEREFPTRAKEIASHVAQIEGEK